MPQLTYAIIDFCSVRDNEEHSKNNSKGAPHDNLKSSVNDDVLVIFFHGFEINDTDDAKNVPQSNSSCLVGMLHISQDVTYTSFNNLVKNQHENNNESENGSGNGSGNEKYIPTEIEKQIEIEKNGKERDEECIIMNYNILSVMRVVHSIVGKQFNLTSMYNCIALGMTILIPVESVWGKESEEFYLFVKVIFILYE